MTDLVQIRYLESSCKYLEPFFFFFFSFPPNSKIKGSSHEKKIKNFDFLKNGSNDLIKFCGFTVHLEPNNMTPLAFPRKIHEARKIIFNFLSGIFR